MPINRTAAWVLGLSQITLTLTAQEIKSLVENPITLIAHPGPNKYNTILYIAAVSNFGTVPFLSPSVSAFVSAQIVYNGPSKWPATASASDLHGVIVTPASAAGNVLNAGSGNGTSQGEAYPLSELVDRDIVLASFSRVSADTPSNYINGDGTLTLTLIVATISIS